MHSEIAIDIDAPPGLVFDLAHDVERWTDLLPHYARSRARERRPDGALVVDFVARRPLAAILGLGLPVAWRARTWNDPATRRLRFVHVAGATRGMDVTWHIEPGAHDAATTRVVIRHDFRPRVPGLATFVDRYFTRPIAGRTLASFKAIAEAVQSGRPSATNQPT
jgi:ribosome-associated toxin RatA of RatAB toxin-antitoxin module